MGKAASSISKLPLHCVDVVEAGEAPRPHRVGCEIGRDLYFDTTGLEAYCFANWDARVFDAFALAAAVQFCDHTRRVLRCVGDEKLNYGCPFMIRRIGARQRFQRHCTPRWNSLPEIDGTLNLLLEEGKNRPPGREISSCRMGHVSSSPSAMASTRSQSLDCWSANMDIS